MIIWNLKTCGKGKKVKHFQKTLNDHRKKIGGKRERLTGNCKKKSLEHLKGKTQTRSGTVLPAFNKTGLQPVSRTCGTGSGIYLSVVKVGLA